MPTSFLGCSSGSTWTRSSKAQASAWPACGALSPGMAAGRGLKVRSMQGLPFVSRYRKPFILRMPMNQLRSILLVEDSAKDVELTLAALEDHGLANEVVVARDGVEALDYLYARGKFARRAGGYPAIVLL